MSYNKLNKHNMDYFSFLNFNQTYYIRHNKYYERESKVFNVGHNFISNKNSKDLKSKKQEV